MKKRTLGVVLSLVMALALGVTAMAAPSKTVTGIVKNVEAEDKDGKDANLVVTELPDACEDAAKEIKKTDTLKDVLGDDYSDKMTVLDVVGLDVLGDASSLKWPVTAKFKIDGVTADTVVKIVQWNGSEWVVVPVTVGKGYVEAKLDEAAPIAFIVDKSTMSTESPKTGDVSTAVIMLMVMAAAGVVVLGKKEFAR